MFGDSKPCIINSLKIIPEFKIRSKVDAKKFIDYCMTGGEYRIEGVVDGLNTQLIMNKKGGKVSVAVRVGDLRDIFNPNIEIASDFNSAYKLSVVDAVWKYRKLINHKLLSSEN